MYGFYARKSVVELMTVTTFRWKFERNLW